MRDGKTGIRSAALAALLLPAAAHADTLQVSVHLITNTTQAHETSPTLMSDGITDMVVYERSTIGGAADLYYQRITPEGVRMGSPIQVTSGPTDDRFSDSGNWILFAALDAPGSSVGQVQLYDVRDGSRIDVIPQAAHVRETRTHDYLLTWIQGDGAAARVQMVDVRWPVFQQMPFPSGRPAHGLALGSRFIVWEETSLNGPDLDIVGYDRDTGDRLRVARSTANEQDATTSGNWIAWQQVDASGATSLWAIEQGRPNSPGQPVRIATATPPAVVRNPVMDGDLVAYESDADGDFDVYVYRLSDRSTHRVTNADGTEIVNDLSGALLTFVDEEASGEHDAWVAHLMFVPDDPCAGAGGDTDGDGVCNDDDNCPELANPEQQDTDGDSIGDACDPLPAGDLCRANGRGRTLKAETQSFAFRVEYVEGAAAPIGYVRYKDSADGTLLRQATFTALTCTDGLARITGTASANGTVVPFTIEARDNGPRGSKETFRVTWPGYEGGGPVGSGNITVRPLTSARSATARLDRE